MFACCSAGGASFGAAGSSSGAPPTGPAGGDLSGTYPDPSVVALTESSGPTRLPVGALANNQLLAVVAGSIVGLAVSLFVPSTRAINTTAPLAGGGDLSADRTLSVATLSNASSGVVPAITAANALPLSNGGGTAVTWVALSGGGSPVGSGRTIGTTAPLSGGGDLSANRTLAVAAISNTSSGVAPQTNGIAGQALLATATATTWSTDFQAQTLTTTGDFVSNVGTGSIRLGLVAGSGSGVQSASATGNIRGARGSSSTGFSLKLRNNGDTDDIFGLQWDSASNVWAVGQSGTGGNTTLQLNCITSISMRRSGGTVMATFSSAGLSVTAASPVIDFNGNSTGNAELKYLGAGAATGNNLTVRAQPGTTTGGRATLIGGDATNASSTGGDALVQTGAGGSGGAGGAGALAAGQTGTAVNRFRWNDTGVGLYNTAPVAQAARVGQLTDSTTGAASNTLVDVTTAGIADVTKVNNNFASVLAKINGIETAIHNIGLTA